MGKIGRLLRTQEEVDASDIHYPFTLAGTVIIWIGSTLALVLMFGGFEICQAVGNCDRSTWSVAHWGQFSTWGSLV